MSIYIYQAQRYNPNLFIAQSGVEPSRNQHELGGKLKEIEIRSCRREMQYLRTAVRRVVSGRYYDEFRLVLRETKMLLCLLLCQLTIHCIIIKRFD